MKKEQTKEKTINHVLLGLIAFLLMVIVISSIFYLRSSRPTVQVEKGAVKIVEKYVDFEEADYFYWFTRKKTYLPLTGTNDRGKEIAVIISKSSEKVKASDQTKGLTEDEAKRTIATAHSEIQIEKVVLGMYDDQPIWEAVGKEANGKLNYYLIGPESGDEVETVKRI